MSGNAAAGTGEALLLASHGPGKIGRVAVVDSGSTRVFSRRSFLLEAHTREALLAWYWPSARSCLTLDGCHPGLLHCGIVNRSPCVSTSGIFARMIQRVPTRFNFCRPINPARSRFRARTRKRSGLQSARRDSRSGVVVMNALFSAATLLKNSSTARSSSGRRSRASGVMASASGNDARRRARRKVPMLWPFTPSPSSASPPRCCRRR